MCMHTSFISRNFVNEKLQQIFIELTLKAEQEDYIAEGIEWTPIAFFDNKIVCELIEEKKPPGVFAILCDVCARIHGDTEKSDSFFSTQLGTLSHPRLTTKGAKFMIKHYAGDVTYEMTGMCEKNRDQLNKDVLEAIKESTLPFLHSLFPEPVDWDQRQRPSMVSEKMRQSAMDLSKTLMSCHPNYVRCIKPNQSKKPLLYTKDLALHQVQYLGLLQNVKVRRAGFAAREPFQLFLQRFYMLSLITCYAGSCSWTGDLKRGCELILKHSGISQQQWQLGKSKVFIKTPETMFKLEALRDKYWHSMARRIQKAWHKYQKKRIESAEKIQAFWKNSSGKNVYVQLRDLGHTVLNQQKERRRFSLLSMRRYMGDYLDVSGSGGMYLRTAAELSQEELILFSLRVEVPVYRLLRGAKLSPRMLVLTDRFLCLVATVKEDQKMVQKLVTKVPITDIQKLEVSPFQDDFVMFHLKDKEDCLIVCPFKNELLTYFVYQWKTPVVFSTEIITTDKANHKKRTTKFIKEDTLQACVFKFKGDKVLVTSGAPPTSVSQPPIRRSKVSQKVKEVSNPAVPKPPSNSVFKKNQPASHAIPVQSKPTPPIPVASTSFTSRKGSMYVVLFTFEAHQTTELGIVEGEEVEELQAEASGWSLVKNKHGKEGWVPSSYLKR
ncbi:class II myosin [Coelomomyces lativittatus]|nr:class II myosin [Coelomomyces lativittatus]